MGRQPHSFLKPLSGQSLSQAALKAFFHRSIAYSPWFLWPNLLFPETFLEIDPLTADDCIYGVILCNVMIILE